MCEMGVAVGAALPLGASKRFFFSVFFSVFFGPCARGSEATRPSARRTMTQPVRANDTARLLGKQGKMRWFYCNGQEPECQARPRRLGSLCRQPMNLATLQNCRTVPSLFRHSSETV